MTCCELAHPTITVSKDALKDRGLYELAHPTITVSKDALKDRGLYEIDQVLMRNGHRLKDFPTFPKSNYIPSVHGGNQLVEKELAYDAFIHKSN
jgi:hypothetical protein